MTSPSACGRQSTGPIRKRRYVSFEGGEGARLVGGRKHRRVACTPVENVPVAF